jgi:anti-sigma-K factor RskA
VGVLVIAALAAAFIHVRDEAAARQRVIEALLRRPSGLEMKGTGGAVARLLPLEHGSLFVAENLSDAPRGHVYQLWLMTGACLKKPSGRCHTTSAGVFQATQGLALLSVSRALKGFDAAAVTIEPEGGSDHPTTTPVIVSV